MKQLPSSTSFNRLSDAIIRSIEEPSETFYSTADVRLNETFVNDYLDKQLSLTKKNQGNSSAETTLPSLHSVDLGSSRILSVDESHELYNLFHLTHGASHFVVPDSISNFNDSTHSLYRFVGGLSFDILSQEQPAKIEDWASNLVNDIEPASTQIQLRVTSFTIEQSSPLESDTFYTSYGKFSIANDLLATDGRTIYILNVAGNVHYTTRREVDNNLGINLQVFPYDSGLDTEIVKNDCEFLIFNGLNWVIITEDKIVKTGNTNNPIIQALPYFFAGYHGWLIITGGSAAVGAAGEAAGGELLFVSRLFATQIKLYTNASPSSIYLDGRTLYVAVTTGATVYLETYNNTLKLLNSTVYSGFAINDLTIANFIVQNAKLYGLVCGLRGEEYSPQLIDFEASEIITFTDQTFTASTRWVPHYKIIKEAQTIIDFRRTNPGAELSGTTEYSYAGLPPTPSDYVVNTRYWALLFNGQFDLQRIRLKAPAAVSIASIHTNNIVQSNNFIYKLRFVPTYNTVVPNARFVRLHTLREFPSKFRTVESPFVADNTARIHYKGQRYSVSLFGVGGFYFTWNIAGVIERNDRLYALMSCYAFTGILRYFLRELTPTGTTTDENLIEISQVRNFVTGYEERVVNFTTFCVQPFSDTFNVEPINVTRLYEFERAHWRKEWAHKHSTSLDVGVVLRDSPQLDANTYAEQYLPNVQVSSMELYSDLSADNITLTGTRYDSMQDPEEFIVSALGTSEYPGYQNPLVDAEVDVLSFGFPAIIRQTPTLAQSDQGIFRVFSGRVESVETDGGQVTVKCIGALEMLSQPYKDVTSASCTYKFGGIRCGKEITRVYGTIVLAGRNNLTVDMGSALPYPVSLYRQGTLRFMTDGFQNVEVDISKLVPLSGSQYRIDMFSVLDYLPPVGTLVVIAHGCTKTMQDCVAYDNLRRGRQMPYLQGARTFTASGMINDGIS